MHTDNRQPQLASTSTQLQGFARGDTVTLRDPKAGERGNWMVVGEVRDSKPEDPAYDVRHQVTGRSRIFRWSRLQLVPAGATPPRARRRRSSQAPTPFQQAAASQTGPA